MWKTLTSLAIRGAWGGSFNNQTGPILVHIYPLFYNNLHVKYRSNMIQKLLSFKIKKKYILYFFPGSCWALTYNPGVSGAPKCQQMQPSSQGRYMYNKGKQFENQFFIHEPKCKNYFLGYLGGPKGYSMIRLGLSCFPAILSPIYMYMSNKETI